MKATVKSSLKQAGLAVLRGTGAFATISNSERRKNRLLILCYHGISLRDEHEWNGGLYVSPEQFRERMGLLRSEGASVISLSEGLERLRTRSLPPLSVAITFDDGFYDFYKYAVPVLRDFDFPCTLYLTTHYCQHRLPVFDLMLNYMLWKSGKTEVHLPKLGIDSPMAMRDEAERNTIVRTIQKLTNKLTTSEKDGIAHQLAAEWRLDYDDLVRSRMLQIMTPDEVTATARGGIDIQLHTHRHRTPRDRELFQREIRDNRAKILDYTGNDPVHFCYPSGDYASEFLPWLAELGVQSATTCEQGLAVPDSEPLALPRFLDRVDINGLDFESWLCGVRV